MQKLGGNQNEGKQCPGEKSSVNIQEYIMLSQAEGKIKTQTCYMATCQQATSLSNSVVHRCTLKHESGERLESYRWGSVSVSAFSCQCSGEVAAAAAAFLGLWIFGQLDGQNLCCTNP